MKLIRQGLERGMFMTFGEKVRSLRKEKKMSQQELASMVGVSYRTIRSWEVEGRFPKQNVLYQKLADALQCDVSYLMSENEAFITDPNSLETVVPNRLSRSWNRLQLCLPVDH